MNATQIPTICPRCFRALGGTEWCFVCRAHQDADLQDDDPRCICGVYRSEHALCGCPDGFQVAHKVRS